MLMLVSTNFHLVVFEAFLYRLPARLIMLACVLPVYPFVWS